MDGSAQECCTNAVVVDCTAYDEAPGAYMDWMRQGLHIVTANKRAGAGDLVRYKLLKKELRKRCVTLQASNASGCLLEHTTIPDRSQPARDPSGWCRYDTEVNASMRSDAFQP